MTDETFRLIEHRRFLQNSNLNGKEEQIQQINLKIRKSCRQELEQDADCNEFRELFSRVRYLSREFTLRTQIIQDEFGNTATNTMEIAEVWRRYCCRLFSGNTNNETNVAVLEGFQKEPDILRTEVERELLKNGVDAITAKVVKAMGEIVINIIDVFCKEI